MPETKMTTLTLQDNWRAGLPQQILPWLPLTLFFPVGVMYAGVLLFYIGFIISGDYGQKWQRVRSSPMLRPVLALSVISILISLLQEWPKGEFWFGFWLYQTYLFLFVFLAVGAGAWQKKAQNIFFAGAIYASTVYYLNDFGYLPDAKLFRSYIEYKGNKSILLGILLALAAGWMMSVWRWQKNHHVWRAAALLYVVSALFLMAKTRTAILIFLLLVGLMLFRNFTFTWRKLLVLAIAFALIAAGINYLAKVPAPATCLVSAMRDANMNSAEVMLTRSVCTVHQVRDFNKGEKVEADGLRLEIYKNTWELIVEKPLLGHGIANWMPLYQAKTKGLISDEMTTPHNEYLLYWTELGVFGMLALIWIWLKQLIVARQMTAGEHHESAMLLAMLGATMILTGSFNAALRDALFGMAFMILLAIPLAGVQKQQAQH